jgi:hypothetical protein
MRVPLFLSAFLIAIFLQIGVPAEFSSGHVYAGCCSCKAKWCLNCTCRGTTDGCPVCGWRETNGPESTTSIADTVSVDIRSVLDLDVVEKATYLTRVGDCARSSLSLKMLGVLGEALKVESLAVWGNQYLNDTGAVGMIVTSVR